MPKVTPLCATAVSDSALTKGQARAKNNARAASLSSNLARSITIHGVEIRDMSFLGRSKDRVVEMLWQSPIYLLAACVGGGTALYAEIALGIGASLFMLSATGYNCFQTYSFGLLLGFTHLRALIVSVVPAFVAGGVTALGAIFIDNYIESFVYNEKAGFGTYTVVTLWFLMITTLFFTVNIGLNRQFSLTTRIPTLLNVKFSIYAGLCFGIIGFIQLLFQFKLLEGAKLNSSESQMEQVFIVGIAFPLYASLGCRVYLSDHIAWASVKTMTPSADDDFKTTAMLMIRVHFITASKCLVAVPGILSLLAVGSDAAFIAGLFFSGAFEISALIAQFYFKSRLWEKTQQHKEEEEHVERVERVEKLQDSPAVASTSVIGLILENPTLANYAQVIGQEWRKDFAKPTYSKRTFALNIFVEDRCEKFIIVACIATVAYMKQSDSGKLLDLALRGAVMFLVEVFIVDYLKVTLLDRLFGIKPFQRVQMAFVEILSFFGFLGIGISTSLFCRFLRLRLDLDCSF